jgi:hypothetical protein
MGKQKYAIQLMQGKDFLYFLMNDISQFYYVDGLGNLQIASNPVPLTFTPDGWMELSILTEKNKKYFGLDRMYGAPQNFVEDGAAILKKLFYGKGFESTVYLLILEQQLYLSDTEFGYYYTQLVKCEVDLSTFVHEGPKVEVSLLEGDITRALKANESTQYELDIDVPEAQKVIMDGLSLKESVQAIVLQAVPLDTINTKNYILELDITTTEQKSTLGTKNTNESTTGYPSDAAILASKRNFLATTIATSVSTGWDFKLDVATIGGPSANKAFLVWRVFDSSGILVNDPSYVLDQKPIPGTGSFAFQYTGSKTVNMPPNCSAFLMLIFSDDVNNNTGSAAITFFVSNTTSTGEEGDPNIKVDYFYKFKSTFAKALPAKYVFTQLISKMTNGKYTGTSSLLDNLDPYVVFTSGDGIRGLAGAKLKTSFTDLFGFINMRFGVGAGVISAALSLEKKSFWTIADDIQVIDIGDGAGLKVSLKTDFLFSSIKIGYPNQTYDTALGDINGRYEFNMTQIYVAPVTRVNTVLDLTTRYRADMYGAEYTRINLEGKTTSDSSSDNDIFVLNILPETFKVPSPLGGPAIDTGYHLLDRTVNQYSVGLLDATSAFNLRLSPKHCLLANGDYLHSCLDLLDNKKIIFSTADKDVAMSVNLPDGTVIEERADVRIGDLPAQLFRPYQLDISIPDRVNLFALSQRRKISFTYPYLTAPLKGFTLKTGSQPSINSVQSYSLLCSADTDLSPLIDVYE